MELIAHSPQHLEHHVHAHGDLVREPEVQLQCTTQATPVPGGCRKVCLASSTAEIVKPPPIPDLCSIETSLTACGKCLEIARRLRNPDPPDSIQLSPLIMMLSCSASWMSSCSSVSMIPIITPYVDLIRAQLQAMSGRYPRVWISDAISFASKPGSPSVSHSLTSAKRA